MSSSTGDRVYYNPARTVTTAIAPSNHPMETTAQRLQLHKGYKTLSRLKQPTQQNQSQYNSSSRPATQKQGGIPAALATQEFTTFLTNPPAPGRINLAVFLPLLSFLLPGSPAHTAPIELSAVAPSPGSPNFACVTLQRRARVAKGRGNLRRTARSIVAPDVVAIRQHLTTMWRLPLAREGKGSSDWSLPCLLCPPEAASCK